MEKIQINLTEGQEIDLEKSDLSKGIIAIKNKYNTYPKSFNELKTSEGYYINNSSVINKVFKSNHSLYDKNVFPKKEQAEAVLALAQLLQLRAAWLKIAGYRDWEYKYGNYNMAYFISKHEMKVMKGDSAVNSKLIGFPTSQLRDDFFDTFEDLLEIAKLLL